MTGDEWEPIWGVELTPDQACHTTCDRHPHRPDRDDPAVSWCEQCGACIGAPSPSNRPSLTHDLERVWLDKLGHQIPEGQLLQHIEEEAS